ncbi:MFS family permease [Pullulanibacillus pueri]|uniref:MFS transporter n=1 Tax=Pullulanibacillus pueri TaxID=1437324 RepID=A0A8J2ZXD0_9BACL|nr:MFS transporter [Pullulanibacillus pueri]MBM7684027.1 MFS family permease [Pullulanibacillus pueri]GGH85045.1 MFS transporter [Pullulanibacillus pueri]
MKRQPGKAAIYLVLFLMSLSLHIQFPIFTPFAIAIGASSFFVSILLSSSSITNLFGHVIAGPFIDRIGKKPFIVLPLFLSSIFMAAHATAHDPLQLLVFRILNGFILAFMGPACFALLAAYARNRRQEGKNMAIHGLTVTLANIIAPFIGGRLADVFDYRGTYLFVGGALFIAALLALAFVKDVDPIIVHTRESTSLRAILSNKKLLPLFFVGFALMFGHGALIYELPFLTVEKGLSSTQTGILFSFMGFGSLVSLSFFWLNRFSATGRIVIGMVLTGLLYYQMAAEILPVGMTFDLFGMGLTFGLIFPAITSLLAQKVGHSQYGSAFGILSAVFSLGAILSTLTSGLVRHLMSPYFLAFIVTTLGAVYLIYDHMKNKKLESPLYN